MVNELVIEHVKIQEKLVEGLSGDDQQQLTQLLKFWLSSFE